MGGEQVKRHKTFLEKNNEDIISQKILECISRQINENSLAQFEAYVNKIETV